MTSFAEISPAQLMRLTGTPSAPEILDVCMDADVELHPCLIPSARCGSAGSDGRQYRLAQRWIAHDPGIGQRSTGSLARG